MGENRVSIILVAFLTAAVIVTSECGFASAEKGPKPLRFTYYMHDDFVPPDVTSVQVASANGTFTYTGIFGDVQVFESPLRKGIEKDSSQVGFVGGEVVFLKGMSFVTFVQNLHIPNYAGTLSASATFNITAGAWEVGISAGTGSFRGARGFFSVTVADPNPLGFILKYDATVYLPGW